MEKQEVEVGNPVIIGDVVLIPVVELSVNYWHGKGGAWFFGTRQPVTIVAVSPSVRRAFRVTGEVVPFDQLVQEVPGIREILVGI